MPFSTTGRSSELGARLTTRRYMTKSSFRASMFLPCFRYLSAIPSASSRLLMMSSRVLRFFFRSSRSFFISSILRTSLRSLLRSQYRSTLQTSGWTVPFRPCPADLTRLLTRTTTSRVTSPVMSSCNMVEMQLQHCLRTCSTGLFMHGTTFASKFSRKLKCDLFASKVQKPRIEISVSVSHLYLERAETRSSRWSIFRWSDPRPLFTF
mmetsp:Transcript_20512/g.51966  ORF Transcript_20512/g.51966 Transcript_20512/m.51966 type:complete len:208 (-) Transcript_20512:303-926(-)